MVNNIRFSLLSIAKDNDILRAELASWFADSVLDFHQMWTQTKIELDHMKDEKGYTEFKHRVIARNFGEALMEAGAITSYVREQDEVDAWFGNKETQFDCYVLVNKRNMK